MHVPYPFLHSLIPSFITQPFTHPPSSLTHFFIHLLFLSSLTHSFLNSFLLSLFILYLFTHHSSFIHYFFITSLIPSFTHQSFITHSLSPSSFIISPLILPMSTCHLYSESSPWILSSFWRNNSTNVAVMHFFP